MTFSLNVLKEYEKNLDGISERLESIFVELNKNQDIFKNYFITVNTILSLLQYEKFDTRARIMQTIHYQL